MFLNLLDELLRFGTLLVLQTEGLVLDGADGGERRALADDRTVIVELIRTRRIFKYYELIARSTRNGQPKQTPHTFSDHLPRPLSLSSPAPASCWPPSSFSVAWWNGFGSDLANEKHLQSTGSSAKFKLLKIKQQKHVNNEIANRGL